MSGFRGAKKPTWSTQAATGAAVVAILDSHKTPGIDAATFGMSALIVLFGVRARRTLGREGTARPSLWSVSAAGIRVVFGSRMLLTLLLFGCWQAFASSPGARPRRSGPFFRCGCWPTPTSWRRPRLRAGPAARHQSPRVRRGPVRPVRRPRARHLLAGGAVAEAIRAPLAVGLAGLMGVA
jgi:hypothetical protein